jgi:hypothetical protein
MTYEQLLIDFSFKSYSMGPKFDQLIQHYTHVRHSAGPWSPSMRHNEGLGSALCCIAWELHTNSIQKIARDHTYSFISRRIHNKMRKYLMKHESGTYMGLFDEKTRSRKSRDTVSLMCILLLHAVK